MKKLLFFVICLFFSAFVFSDFYSPPQAAAADTAATRLQLVTDALKQIRNDWSELMPAGAWSGWDGSDSGITTGSDYPGTEWETPWVQFDNTQIRVAPDNTGTPAPTSAGVTYPMPDSGVYSPTCQVIVSLNGKYVDSNLLRIKTVLFHELVHVAHWRDTDGHWDQQPDDSWVFNDPKDDDLKEIKEIEASGRTLEFLQALLKKGEFKKKDILAEIRREMDNLQNHLKDAAAAAERIKPEAWGANILGKWLPKDLVALILLKKFAYYGWATSGPITNEQLGHLMDVVSWLDSLDGTSDGKIYDEDLGSMIVAAILSAKAEKELRGHLLVNAVLAFDRGDLESALDKLQSLVNRIEAQRQKLGDEVANQALALVDLVRDYMLEPVDPLPEPVILHPLPGEPVVGWITITVVEASDAPDIGSVDFEYAESGSTIWNDIGPGIVTAAGWSIEWDTFTLLPGPYLIRATMTDFAGQTGTAQVEVMILPP